jgi:tetratricopeptide (TPR) repeat protein
MTRRLGPLAAALLLAASPAPAQQPDHAAHAVAERLGTVHFATSCAPAVAPAFDRAVALLHSFEFGASTRAFSQVLATDSTCAMAHWGLALTRWSNPMSAGNRAPAQLTAGRAAVDEAARLGARASERERGYIAAAAALYTDWEHTPQLARVGAYERAMADLVARQPADTEAMIFHAIAMAAAAPPTDKTYASQLRAGALLEALWERQPDHPGLAHYIIHTYDVPALAPRAKAAAERYARIAPSAAHALHMPSHTFTRVGAWNESVETNQRSIRVALASGAISEALHASDYVMYAELQRRHMGAAKAVLDGLPALAARFDPNAVTGAAPGSAGVFALAAIPARWALERRAWPEAAALPLRGSAFAWTDAMTHFARALGAARSGDAAAAQKDLERIAALGEQLKEAKSGYWAGEVEVMRLAAGAWVALAQGNSGSALEAMRRAADLEDKSEKHIVTPARLLPARELLGDMLLELKRPADALKEYEASQVREPNRLRGYHGAGLAAAQAGQHAKAKQHFGRLVALAGKGEPRPEVAAARTWLAGH